MVRQAWPFQDSQILRHMHYALAPAFGAWRFPPSASFRICVSKVSSAAHLADPLTLRQFNVRLP